MGADPLAALVRHARDDQGSRALQVDDGSSALGFNLIDIAD